MVPAVLGACAGDARAPLTEVQRRDSVGVEVVVSPAADRFLELEETLRIGVVEGDERYQLDRIRGLDVHADGRILVTNGGSSTLRVYSPDGRFLVEMGGEGDGPGELRSVTGGRFAGDSIIAISHLPSGLQLTIFDDEGDFGRELTLEYRRPLGAGVVLEEPAWYAWTRTLPPSRVPEGERAETYWNVHRVDRASGELGERVLRLPGGVLVGVGDAFGSPPLFEPKADAAPLPGGGALVRAADAYELRVLDAGGRTLRIVRRVHDPVPITDRDRERFQSRVTEYFHAEGRSPASLERALRQTPRSDFVPPIEAMWATPSGGFWVRRADGFEDPLGLVLGPMTGGGPSTEPVQWDGFSADGTYRGSLRVPASFNPHFWSDASVVGVLRNELDVEFVARHEIRG